MGAVALALGILAAVVLGVPDRVLRELDGRWAARLQRGEELYAEGRYEQAAAWLEQLDRQHPAGFVKHHLDRQRERVLELLARSHAALERKGRALEAARRAVAFDPRNWRNHRLEAEVALACADGVAADAALERVLSLHPSHLASVTDRVRLAFEGGRYAEVPPLFETYLDAWRPAAMALEAAGRRGGFELAVDGRPHVVEAVLAEHAGAAAGVALDPAGYAVRVERAELLGSAAVGRPGPAPALELTGPEAPFVPATADEPGAGNGLALGPAPPFAPERARLVLTAYKALPAELWEMVETAYENTLDRDGLAAARARVLVGAPDAPLQYLD